MRGVLGSASPQLVKGVSESLAGRIGSVDLSGFALWEVGTGRMTALWLLFPTISCWIPVLTPRIA